MGIFKLHTKFPPAGDQPEAIAALVSGLRSGKRHQTLRGVTGSGKTFTVANVIMPNVGGLEHRRDYTLYDGKAGMDENAEACRRKRDESLAAIGEHVRYRVSGTPLHYLKHTGQTE